MDVFGYMRVSTEEQANDGHGLARMDAQIRAYCELYGLTLVDLIVDRGVSGSTPLEKRPGGGDMLDRLKDGEAQGVVAPDLDRLFRLAIDGLMTFAWFDRRGITVHAVNDRIDTETPEGKLALTIRLATAEFERNKTAQRTRDTMANMRSEAKVYGPVPFGCRAEGGRLFRDADTWRTREWIVSLFRSEDGPSMRAIGRLLEREGVRAPNGGKLWHVSTLQNIIESHDSLQHIPEYAPAPETADSLVGLPAWPFRASGEKAGVA